MKLPDKEFVNQKSITTAGATGITLMTLHITGYLTGWAWPLLYIFLILVGIGSEQRRK